MSSDDHLYDELNRIANGTQPVESRNEVYSAGDSFHEFWEPPSKAYRRQRRERTRDGLHFLWTYYRVPFIGVLAGITGGILVVVHTVYQLVT